MYLMVITCASAVPNRGRLENWGLNKHYSAVLFHRKIEITALQNDCMIGCNKKCPMSITLF